MCEGMLVAGEVLLHLQSTAKVPLSKVLNPRDAQAELATHSALHICSWERPILKMNIFNLQLSKFFFFLKFRIKRDSSKTAAEY